MWTIQLQPIFLPYIMMFLPYGFVVLKGLMCHLEVLLQQRELFWIFTLQTLSPNGMNDEALFNVML